MKALVPRRLLWPAPVILLAAMLWAPSAHAYVYWGAFGSIGRAGNDGSTPEPEFINATTGFVCGVAVDSGHIYWADRLTETIGRANIDGGEVEPEFIKGAHQACGVAVSPTHVYWTSTDGFVGYAGIDGSSPQVAMTGGKPCGIAVGPAYAYYMTDLGSSTFKIVRTSLSAPGPIVDTFTASPTGDCGLAFAAERLYWTNGGFNSGSTSGLWSVGKEPNSVPTFLASTEPEPWSVATDGTYAYWTSYKGGPLNRVKVDGTLFPEKGIVTGIKNESVGLAVDARPLLPVEPPPAGGGSETPGGSGQPGGGSSGGGGGSGSANPPATPPPTTTAPPKPRPPACKKGTRRKVVKGKARCVKVKKHKHRRHHHAH